ncbi:hypothetical protein BDGGKGIB_03613 [Nodularia sphaerocarpa UHCC 0038]|nr:hypothetical protein BDGGKGIB_03613 [Nodularia sphaerocarpa UHCC 0038]
MQNSHPARFELRLTLPPNLSYSLEGADLRKTWIFFDHILQKISTSD